MRFRLAAAVLCTVIWSLLSLQPAYSQQIHKEQRVTGLEEPFGREMDWVAPGAGHLFRIE